MPLNEVSSFPESGQEWNFFLALGSVKSQETDTIWCRPFISIKKASGCSCIWGAEVPKGWPGTPRTWAKCCQAVETVFQLKMQQIRAQIVRMPLPVRLQLQLKI